MYVVRVKDKSKGLLIKRYPLTGTGMLIIINVCSSSAMS